MFKEWPLAHSRSEKHERCLVFLSVFLAGQGDKQSLVPNHLFPFAEHSRAILTPFWFSSTFCSSNNFWHFIESSKARDLFCDVDFDFINWSISQSVDRLINQLTNLSIGLSVIQSDHRVNQSHSVKDSLKSSRLEARDCWRNTTTARTLCTPESRN